MTVETGSAQWQAPGATTLGDGRWRLEVWAPRTEQVVAHLPGDRRLVLTPQPAPPGGVGGYHCAEVDGLAEGDCYRYSLDGGPPLPDPASRWQPQGVHGPSALLDATGLHQRTGDPPVQPTLHQSVFYELHVGTFTRQGTFDAAISHLDHLVDLGVTTVEIMPVAQFPGARNWGYDGVFPYAVQDSYGGPHGLARLIAACHQQGLAVALDVVYNHLGPEGNILPRFGPYTTDRYATPWGPAINFDGWGSDEVRRFFVGNALWWFDQFHVDALRLDAVHGIVDPTARPFLQELGEATALLARSTGRRLLLVAESADNNQRLDEPVASGGMGLDGQWSDDFHHSLHAVLTGERRSYYQDFGSIEQLATAIDQGFVFTGQFSGFRGRRHGQDASRLAPWQLVIFDQNHDQIGNRPRGDRLAAMARSGVVPAAVTHLAAVLTMLAPGTPLLFMGEEYGETAPFPYFVDHGDPDLIEAVRRGRAAEMGDLWDVEPLDPADPATFTAATIDLSRAAQPEHHPTLHLYRTLLRLRRTHPALNLMAPPAPNPPTTPATAASTPSTATTTSTTTTTSTKDNLLIMHRRSRPAQGPASDLLLLWHAGPDTVTASLPAADADTDVRFGSGSSSEPWRLLLGTPVRLSATHAELGPWSYAVVDRP